jgi:peptidoglycan/xylan/chitin deacetylase (PgdA/CDA1 family)
MKSGGADASCRRTPFRLFVLSLVPPIAVLALVDVRLAAALAAAGALVVLAAPFFPKLRFFVPVIVHGDRNDPRVALTFDDGPDQATTPALLRLLSRHRITAAFFPVGRKAERHPELVRAILDAGHEIGNHTYGHDVFLMLRRAGVIRAEVAAGADVLRNSGIRPLAFRPPVGITNPVLCRVLRETGSYCVGFRRHPADFGNRRLHGLHRRVLRNVRAGDILLLHDGRGSGRFEVERWLGEVEAVIQGLAVRGLEPAVLSDVIRRPVMDVARTEEPRAAGERGGSSRPGENDRPC